MDRYIDLKEISDGKLYGSNDLVKAGCGDCQGCSACCESMADTIILDPMDLYLLTSHLGIPISSMLYHQIDLGVVDGVILPHLKMAGSTNRCPFLTEAGRCSIHEFRPGFCRLFPLGRYYENRSFRYFLQIKECLNQNRTKVKIRKWIGMPDFDRYETFIKDWHYFLKDLQKPLAKNSPQWAKNVNLLILNELILKPYSAGQETPDSKESDGKIPEKVSENYENFYPQFYERLQEVTRKIEAL